MSAAGQGMLSTTGLARRGWVPGVLPGFGPTLGITLTYLSLIVLIPLAGLVLKTSELRWSEFWQTISGARALGAGGFRIFLQVTLPKIKWGLLYGIILCNARAMGEFGAVSVVSGHIRGQTNTMPLQVEILYNEYDSVGAFMLASLLMLLALATLVAKKVIEARQFRR